MKQISYMEAHTSHLFIDVRSPSEYAHDHIPGAVNLPLFSDEERAAVGTCYVQTGRQEAKALAASFVSPKLPDIMDAIISYQKENPRLVCYCQKGGYRSRFIVALFCAIDMPVWQLEGGYKEYRRIVRENLASENENITYAVLHGNTGVGKTEVLLALQAAGKDILDLEAAANHRGSLLGGIGLSVQHSQKWFESLLYQQMCGRKSDLLFIEAESDRIGRVNVPKYIINRMKQGYHILIQAEEEVRINILKKEYGNNSAWVDEARACMPAIERYIGKEKFAMIRNALDQGDFGETAGLLMKHYYDPMYEHKNKCYTYQAVIHNTGAAAAAAELIINQMSI